MKKLLSLLAIVFGSIVFANAVSAATPKSDIEFTNSSHDFGTIKEKGGIVECDFEFKNVGDAPLVILSATAGCGCTTPTYPTDPINPGEKGKIHVKYNPKGHPGEFNRTVKVRTNSKKSKVVLRITGNVIPGAGK